MNPSLDFLHQAEAVIRETLMALQPRLLEAQGKIGHHLKDDKSAVTEMDTLVENHLRKALEELDPGIAFSGEESGVDYTQPTFWLVDPIDGTEPFIRGLPFATNMIALIDNGQPVMGIINNIALGHYYLAIKGQGATRNGHPIHVSNRPVDRSFVSIGSARAEATEGFGVGDRLRQELGVNALMKFGATGAELMAVATGGIEARITYKGRAKPYDFAPGALIVQEAGGRVVNIGSDTYDFTNPDVLAAAPSVFDTLQQFFRDLQRSAASQVS